MATKGRIPGDPDSAPIESRRSEAAADVGGVAPDEVVEEEGGQDSVIDLPDLGEFSAESARPTPLDDIAEAEREKVPRD